VRNTDPTNTFWVERSENHVGHEVSIDDLMITNTLIITSTNMDDKGPKRIRPGDKLSDDGAVSPDDDTQSDVISLRIYADNNGKPGQFIGNFMSAAQTIRRAHGDGVRREQDGRHTVNFTVEPTTNYVVQASDDLRHWTNVGTINTNEPAAHFTDDNSTNHPSRYYRLQQ
jgi:hypothetical protein